MKSVWILMVGEYSDTSFCGAFSSRENAEKYFKEFEGGREDGDIFESEIDPLVGHLMAGKKRYQVNMRKDGNGSVHEVSGGGDNPFDTGVFLNDRGIKAGPNDTERVFVITVWAKDKRHAAKIVNEKRTQMIASGEW